MATLNNNEIQFTGSMGKMTAYRMRGSDKVVVRLKSGPTKKQIRYSRKFEHTRLNNSEFAGAIETVKSIRGTLPLGIRRLADHNFTPRLVSICKRIQLQEKTSDKGKRGILLSEHRDLLEGFSFNRKYPLFGVVANPIRVVIDREEKKAVVQLPRLLNEINFTMPWMHPVYRLVVSLGIADDIVYNSSGYTGPNDYKPVSAETEWHLNGAPFRSHTFELALDTPGPLKDNQTMIVCAGIEMGAPNSQGEPDGVRYAGSACILALG